MKIRFEHFGCRTSAFTQKELTECRGDDSRVGRAGGGFGVRGHVTALELDDMSSSSKARSCPRTPQGEAQGGLFGPQIDHPRYGRLPVGATRAGLDARAEDCLTLDCRRTLLRPGRARSGQAGFTMVEIAICLAIIGLGLVAIVGVLPIGLNVQRDNREETVINQDATVLMESIRNGVQSGYDLTNYVFAITNYWTTYSSPSQATDSEVDGYSYFGSSKSGTASSFGLNNNARIIGLLSTPEYTKFDGTPRSDLFGGGYSNHVVAYVRAMSGPAVEKPPQDNAILIQDSFSYRMVAVNAPLAVDTNVLGALQTQALPQKQGSFAYQLAGNLHELRLTFTWPVRPNGSIGSDGPLPQTQRTLVAGTFYRTNDLEGPKQTTLYFYQSQNFATNTQ